MKTIIALFYSLFWSLAVQAIDGPPFEVIGNAKLITTIQAEDDARNVAGKISTGETIKLSYVKDQLVVDWNSGKKQMELLAIDDFVSEWIMLSVYEYDFDQDGKPEIMVIDSPDYFVVNIHIYSLQDDDLVMTGDLFGQYIISLEKDVIALPYGSQGLTDEYLYRNGAFFNLIYHDPIKKD